MLRCPECDGVYKDETQIFCTRDGKRLIANGNQAATTIAQNADKRFVRASAPGELLVEAAIAPLLAGLPLAPDSIAPPAQNDFETRAEAFGAKSKTLAPPAAAIETKDQSAAQQPKIARALGQVDDFAPNSNSFDDYQSKELSKSKEAPKRSLRKSAPLIVGGALAALLLLAALSFAAADYLASDAERKSIIADESTQGESTQRESTQGESIQTPPPDVAQNAPPQSFALPQSTLPAGFVRFENQKERLDDKLKNRFVAFSLAYPESWRRSPITKDSSEFLDIANRAPNRLPLEQLLVSWYESRGTFAADQASFPVLVEKSRAKLADPQNGIPQFRKVSEGAIKFSNRDAYEFRFAGATIDENKQPIEIWGRTIFLPPNNENQTTGLTLTMLATSLEPTITSLNDVGEQGELARVAKTFRLEE